MDVETVVGVISQAKRKTGFFSSTTYALVVTDRRLLLAEQTGDVTRRQAAEAKAWAQAAGKGIRRPVGRIHGLGAGPRAALPARWIPRRSSPRRRATPPWGRARSARSRSTARSRPTTTATIESSLKITIRTTRGDTTFTAPDEKPSRDEVAGLLARRVRRGRPVEPALTPSRRNGRPAPRTGDARPAGGILATQEVPHGRQDSEAATEAKEAEAAEDPVPAGFPGRSRGPSREAAAAAATTRRGAHRLAPGSRPAASGRGPRSARRPRVRRRRSPCSPARTAASRRRSADRSPARLERRDLELPEPLDRVAPPGRRRGEDGRPAGPVGHDEAADDLAAGRLDRRQHRQQRAAGGEDVVDEEDSLARLDRGSRAGTRGASPPSASRTSSAKIPRTPSWRAVSKARTMPAGRRPGDDVDERLAVRSARGGGPEGAQLARHGRVLEEQELLQVALAVAARLEEEVALLQRAGAPEERLRALGNGGAGGDLEGGTDRGHGRDSTGRRGDGDARGSAPGGQRARRGHTPGGRSPSSGSPVDWASVVPLGAVAGAGIGHERSPGSSTSSRPGMVRVVDPDPRGPAASSSYAYASTWWFRVRSRGRPARDADQARRSERARRRCRRGSSATRRGWPPPGRLSAQEGREAGAAGRAGSAWRSK